MEILRLLPCVACLAISAAVPLNDTRAQISETAPVSPIPNPSKQCSPITPGHHETYHLPSSAKASENVTFATNWNQVQTGGWYAQQVMDSCRIKPDGFVTWHGNPAVRVEVQPNDDPLALDSNSERAEMLLMQDAHGNEIRENANRGTQYYATSYYFPATWQGQQLPWSAFAPKDCSVGSRNDCNSWSYVWQFYGWAALSAAQSTVNGSQRYFFNNTQLADGGLIKLGKWTDFVFMVDWGTGAYTIWRRDEGETNFTQAINGKTPIASFRDVYVKQGLYRGGNVGGRTDVLWIGPTARGSSFSAVERQAFGTDNGISDNVSSFLR
jgi:hypothetical protein